MELQTLRRFLIGRNRTNAINRKEFMLRSGAGLVAMKTCSGGSLKEDGESRATYTAALKWIFRNKNISTMVPGMGNFREIEEDVQAMWG